jgi:nitroreductase
MRFIELAAQRKSIRAYKKDPVPAAVLEEVLEAGRLAPSAVNFQPWRFIVLTEASERRKAAAAYPKEWFAQAPAIIVICARPAAAWSRCDGVNYAFVDCAIAADHMTLCAAEHGFGTCWIGAFDPAVLRKELELPAELEPVAMLLLGIPAEAGRPKNRKPSQETVQYGLHAKKTE